MARDWAPFPKLPPNGLRDALRRWNEALAVMEECGAKTLLTRERDALAADLAAEARPAPRLTPRPAPRPSGRVFPSTWDWKPTTPRYRRRRGATARTLPLPFYPEGDAR